MRYFRLTLGALAILAGGSATAQDMRAIMIANGNYDVQRDISEAATVLDLSERLSALGFEVSTFEDQSADTLRSSTARISTLLRGSGDALVFVAGHVAGNERDSWLLSTDAGRVDGMGVGLSGFSLAAISDAMGGVDGQAVLLVGLPGMSLRTDPSLTAMLNQAALAEGVTVFSGPIDDLTEWARDELLQPGATYAGAIRNAPRSVRAFGDLPTSQGLVPEGAGNLPDELETLLFDRAELLNSETALQDYLDRFPQGFYAEKARKLLADLQRTPTQSAQDAEAALNLSRSDRQAIQSNLTLLGYDTNGIDGLFGQGTRRAVSKWQAENNRDATGYLSRTEITRIAEQANAERKKSEEADSALWADTRSRDTKSGYVAYLDRYPQGLFADLARTELRKFEDRDWQVAQERNDADAYKAFLSEWPNGANAAQARARLASLDSAVDLSAARREEQELFSNPLTRILAERRLNDLGYRPGVVDGQFDDDTRNAVRRFQRDKGLSETGIVDKLTAARLLTN